MLLKVKILLTPMRAGKAKKTLFFRRTFELKILQQSQDRNQNQNNLALQRFETEITLLRPRVPKYKNKYKKIDAMMYD